MEEHIQIVEYDPRWPVMAREEVARIQTACGARILAMEHAGSTAVPGLASKPVIDLLGAVRKLSDANALIEPLSRLGYEFFPPTVDEIRERRYFRKFAGGRRSHHLHLCLPGGAFWDDHLLFRDYLRGHPDAADAYAGLKRELARVYAGDRYGYTAAKGPFITACLEQARAGQRRNS